MQFGQIVDLSLAGYSREQITAIDAMASQNPKAVDLALSVKNFEELSALAGMASDDSAQQKEPEPQKQDESDPAKTQKEETKPDDGEKDSKIKELEEQLAAAQRANANIDLSQTKKNEKTAEDIFSDFINTL